MRIRYHPDFIKKLKKSDVRLRKSFINKITIFEKNPTDPILNNHALKRTYLGHRSIDITNDWRAIYKESHVRNETTAYFIIVGTHKELYDS